MCMKNINTDILFFEEINNSSIHNDLLNLYGITKNIPEVKVKELNENTFLIPQISLMLSINATDKGINKGNPTNTIDFDKIYRICIRITETTSGQCVDTIQFDIHPCEEAIHLCRKTYNKRTMYRLENISVVKPPKDKDLCVFKVLIQEVVNGNISEDKWIAQSMHPVRMLVDK